jgi:phosphoglycolate phosphatase
MRPTVLLFDIDGTLVTTGGVGRRAIEKTFAVHFGRPDACSSFRFDGMTDRAIMRQGLLALEQPATAEAITELLAHYLRVLETEVAEADMSRYRVHPGMREAIDAAHARGMAVGLGTGNIREGARVKLNRVSLFERFSFGGFGCDHEVRLELIRTGAQRGAELLKAPLTECRVVVIGDTPKDIAAAHGIGAECVGVGTGSFTAAQLLEHGANAAFADLSAPGALRAVLGG